jgi:hypothetical protein
MPDPPNTVLGAKKNASSIIVHPEGGSADTPNDELPTSQRWIHLLDKRPHAAVLDGADVLATGDRCGRPDPSANQPGRRRYSPTDVPSRATKR